MSSYEKDGEKMTRKRYAKRAADDPDRTLGQVMALLGGSDDQCRAGVLRLVTGGPWPLMRTDWSSVIAAEGLTVGRELFLTVERLVRDVNERALATDSPKRHVGLDGDRLSPPRCVEDVRLPTAVGFTGYMWFDFSANEDGRVWCAIDGPLGNIALLQLVQLLDRVGVRRVRRCSAEDCDRIYVKSYRRVFCCMRCQKRTYARAMRGRHKELRERRRRARLRRLGES